MKNEMQMFAFVLPCKVHICICSIMQTELCKFVYTFGPEFNFGLMDVRLMVCGDVNTHSANKPVQLLLHVEVSLNAQRPISSISSMLLGHKGMRGCASIRACACDDADGGD